MRNRATLGVVSVILILSLLLTPVAGLSGIAYAGSPPSEAPVHLSPAEDATGLSLTPTFEWDPVPEATHYALYISKDPYGPDNLVFNSEEDYEPDHGPITGNSFNLPGGFLEQDIDYRWHMRAGNDAGWGDLSDHWYFTTGNLAQLIEDNIMEDGEGRELKFPVTVGGEEYYIVYLDSYIDPQTWETHPRRGIYEPVFVDAQGRPVHDNEMARKIAVIERARVWIYGRPPNYDSLGGIGSPFHIGDEIFYIDQYMTARGVVKQLEWALDVHAKALVLVVGWGVSGKVVLTEFGDFVVDVAKTAPEEVTDEVYTWVAEKVPGLTSAEIQILVDLGIDIAEIAKADPDDLDGATFVKYMAELLELGSKDARQMAEEIAVQGLERAKELYSEASGIANAYQWRDPFSEDALADYEGAAAYLEAFNTALQVERMPAWSLLMQLDEYPQGWWGNFWDFVKRVGSAFADTVRKLFTDLVPFGELIMTSMGILESELAEEWEWLEKYYDNRESAYLRLEEDMQGSTALVSYTLQLAAGLPAPQMVTLTLDSTPGGWVAWPGEEQSTYEEDMEVDLVAMWDEGYRFSHWSGDVDTMTDTTADFTKIVMDSDKSVTAHFEEVEEGTFPGALETTLWGYYAAWGKALPSIEERGKMFEVLGLGLADEYVGAFDQNNELLDALKALRIAPSTVQELLRYLDLVDDLANVDLVLVLDRSTSMRGARIQGAKDAAISVVNMLMPHDRVAVVSFGSTATRHLELTSDFEHARTEIENISLSGATSFGAGLKLAVEELEERGSEDHVPVILFLSDGHHNRAPAPDAYVQQCKDHDPMIPIYTVGLADHPGQVGEALLKWMAEETGGEYFFVDDLYDLQNIFVTFTLQASGWPLEAEFSGQVGQGETVVAGNFTVAPGTDYVRVTLNWPGSDLDLIIERPDGTEVALGRAPDNIYSGNNAKPEWVILLDPEPGLWTVKVYGKKINPHSDYIVWVSNYVDPLRKDPDRPMPVGGSAYPVSRLALLAPWIALTVIMAGAGLLVLRRRQAQI